MLSSVILAGAVMSLESLSVCYTPIKGVEWVLVAVLIAAFAVVTWESWETRRGNNRPVLRAGVGVIFLFLSILIVHQGIGLVRLHASSYRWIFDFVMGLASLVWSIIYLTGRRGTPGPSGIFGWLSERAKPSSMFDNKKD